MKKILAILAMAISTGAFAASATIEYQDFDGVKGTSNGQQVLLAVKQDFNKNFAGDVKFSNQWKDQTNSLSSRTEVGLTGTEPVAGIGLYTRLAVGEKFTGTSKFGYYSAEPGILVPVGKTGLTAKLAYRYQAPFETSNVDTTRTWRAGVAYDLTKNDNIGVRYDRVRGDSNSNGVAVFYTRGF